MKEELRRKLLAVFQAESRDHVEYIRAALVRADAEPLPAPELDEAFRRAHSLKGAARAVDLPAVQTLAHRMETLFSRVREGKLSLDKPARQGIQRVLDVSDDWVAALFQGQAPPDTAPALAAIDGILGDAPAPTPPAPAQESPAAPAPAAPRETVPPDPPPSASHPSSETLRVSAESLDHLLRTTDQLLTESLGQDNLGRELDQIGRRVRELEKDWEHTRRGAALSLQELAQNPRYARVARFMDSVAHAVHGLSRQVRAARAGQRRGAWSLRHGAQQLQRDVRRARMVPAEGVFQGFRKMVRDLARDEGKQVDFKTEGLDIEADRVVLQALKDPVMHMLTNALHHGIEPPEERRRAGKPPEAALMLRLEARGDRLTLTVEDDGRGLDLARIREIALRKRLLSDQEADRASREELSRMIFRPGFSTARAVTEVSGRGMGLSVVEEAVARLQGELQVPAREKSGTAIVLSVPLTVSTHRVVLLTAAGRTFAAPAAGVERMLRARVEEIRTVEGRPAISMDGQILALRGLAQVLGVGDAAAPAEDGRLPVMVLRSGPRRLAVAVDGFLSERDAVIAPLTGPAARAATVMGVVLMEDGSLAPVLDPARVLEASREAGPVVFRPVEKSAAKEAARILIADDSITTRTLEKSILEAHGYQVRAAVDGMEALSCLRSDAFDLVISDVQMPRLDGLGLLQELKRDPKLAKVPVILVTSLESKQDQERGLSLGADAYIVKRKFDQRDLLETVKQIL